MNVTQKYKLLYEEGYEFLLEMLPDSRTKEDLETFYFKPSKDQFTTIEDVFCRMIASAQNTGRREKVIRYWGKNSDAIHSVLDPIGIKGLAHTDPHELYLQLHDACIPRKPINKNDMWSKWSKSIVDCAKFLEGFDDAQAFFDFADFFARPNDVPEKARPYIAMALPFTIQSTVFGMGLALALDFLKEVGYDSYAKPDVHLRRVFEELGLAYGKSDFDCFRAIAEAASTNDITPYKLDKLIWLICSGTFYEINDKQEVKVTGKREEFIEHMRRVFEDGKK